MSSDLNDLEMAKNVLKISKDENDSNEVAITYRRCEIFSVNSDLL